MGKQDWLGAIGETIGTEKPKKKRTKKSDSKAAEMVQEAKVDATKYAPGGSATKGARDAFTKVLNGIGKAVNKKGKKK